MGEIKMKKNEAKKMLEDLKTHTEKTLRHVGYYFPEMVYKGTKVNILKSCKKTAKTKGEIALSLGKEIPTVAPVVSKMVSEGIVSVHGSKKVNGKTSKTYKAVAPAS